MEEEGKDVGKLLSVGPAILPLLVGLRRSVIHLILDMSLTPRQVQKQNRGREEDVGKLLSMTPHCPRARE
jgi:hypothetical protein